MVTGFAQAMNPVAPIRHQPISYAMLIQEPIREVPRTIEEVGVVEMMAAFRVVARKQSVWSRDSLLTGVGKELGFRRISGQVGEVLRAQLATAIDRGIIVAHVMEVSLDTKILGDYDTEDLITHVQAVIHDGMEYDREDLTRQVCDYLGFARITDAMRTVMNTALTTGIRTGEFGFRGNVIWRA